MESEKSKTDLIIKRRSDFYTGTVLLIGSFIMLMESFTFPMKESYGGVENVWYVSPALLPMIVSSLLILLSIILIRKSIQDGGMHRAFNDFRFLGTKIRSESFLRLVIIVLYISIYVYGMIPNGDFYLVSMVFLFAFILPFYSDKNSLFLVCFWPFFIVGIIGLTITFNTRVIDYLILGLMFFMVLASWLIVKKNNLQKKKWLTTFLTSVIAPLILIPAFKFGLLVPLPTEGIVIKFLERIAFNI